MNEGHNSGYMLDTVLAYLKSDSFEGVMRAQGIPAEEWTVVLGPAVWTSQSRATVRRVCDALMFGVTDMAGLPRVNLSAEFVAAVGALVVNPVNWQVFARFYENANSLNSLKMMQGEEDAEGSVFEEGIRSATLLAMIHEVYAARMTGNMNNVRNELVASFTNLNNPAG